MKRTRFTWMLPGCTLLTVWSQLAWAAPNFKWPRAAHTAKLSCQPPAKPRGVRLRVLSYFRVTNAIDGSRDNEVEMFGVVNFNGQAVWNVDRNTPVTAVRDLNRRVEVSNRTFDIIYNQPATSKLKIGGSLNDRDESGGDDTMWNPQKRVLVLDIEKVSNSRNPIGTYIMQGDRDRESADLIFVVSKDGDIY